MELGWLFASPIAHRGLHDAASGTVENSASAAWAAIERGFGIECDVQRTADGEAVVFHDFTLDRLTGETGPVADRTLAQLRHIRLLGGPDAVPSLVDFLGLIGGRAPLTIEIKSRFDGDMRLADRVAEIVVGHGGPLALKSFDPQIVARLRAHPGLGHVPCGIVAQARYEGGTWTALSEEARHALAHMLHFADSRPDFLSYHVADLPHAAPNLLRTGLGLPVMAWTVRNQQAARHGRRWADQIVFEGFDPACAG